MRWRVAGIAVLGVLAAAVGIKLAGSSSGIELKSVPEGVSARHIGGTPVFLVRSGTNVAAFATDVQHLPGEDHLWWCPSEGRFASPTHGELFDRQGQVIGGPARNGLGRFVTRTVDGRLHIDLDKLTPGAARDPGSDAESSPSPGWDSGPGSFCAGAVKL